MPIINSELIAAELMKRNLLPKRCTNVQIEMTPRGAMQINYTVYVDAEQLGAIAEVLKDVSEKELSRVVKIPFVKKAQ